MIGCIWEALKCKAEALEWSWYDDGDGCIQLGKYTPAGEDFFIIVRAPSFAADVRAASDWFDAEEHVRELLNAKVNGFTGIPDVKTLVEDAEAIQEMLNELADALEEVEAA